MRKVFLSKVFYHTLLSERKGRGPLRAGMVVNKANPRGLERATKPGITYQNKLIRSYYPIKLQKNIYFINTFITSMKGSQTAGRSSPSAQTRYLLQAAISSIQSLKSVTIRLICILHTTTGWLQSVEAEGNTDSKD